MNDFLQWLTQLITNPIKAAWTVATGTFTGYIPNLANIMDQSNVSEIDTWFQHTVWTLTILVAITALISWVQKQIDRIKKKREERENEV